MLKIFFIRLASEDVPVSVTEPTVTIAKGKSSIRTIVQIAKRKEQPHIFRSPYKILSLRGEPLLTATQSIHPQQHSRRGERGRPSKSYPANRYQGKRQVQHENQSPDRQAKGTRAFHSLLHQNR